MSCDSCHLKLVLVSALLVLSTDARSWDLAVTIGQEVNFFARNGTQTGQVKLPQVVAITGIAYDDAKRTIYLSDSGNKNFSIYSQDLSEKKAKPYPMLKKQNGTYIMGMVFDTVSRTLFWTDFFQQAVISMHLPFNETHGTPSVLHSLKSLYPRGIALDVCNRHIYWTNTNMEVGSDMSEASIERSKMDGSDRTVVINSNLHEPVGLAIDHATGKLYWIDDQKGIHYKVERSNLDGSERETLIYGTYHQPVHLAVDDQAVYWTDRVSNAIWTIEKDKNIKNVPVEFKSYHKSHRSEYTSGIITRDNVGNIDCKPIFRVEKDRASKPTVSHTVEESFNNLTASTEEIDYNTPADKLCLNDGRYNEMDSSCKCQPGYSGALCEINSCHNYCVRGNCVIDNGGSPRCECGVAHSGSRCEQDVCDGYCLNGGQCSVSNGKPICACKHSRSGQRCEDTIDRDVLCSFLCASSAEAAFESLEITSCRCSEVNQTLAQGLILNYNDNFLPSILLPTLVALIGVLTVVIAVLSYHVNKLRRRPRIKKRFVVSKGGVTPLTSRPQIPADRCEITIENCCNMNICETPCFEPKLRSAPTKNSNNKKEEKNSLLNSMEGGDSC